MELHDPLTYPQLIAFYDAIDEVQSLRSKDGATGISSVKARHIYLPSLIGCVAKWDLENFPENVTFETFPATPLIASGEIVDWLQGEVIALMTATSEVPNES